MNITDAGVRSLAGLEGVRDLSLSACVGVTGAGMARLYRLPLQRLNLSETSVTPRGLAQVMALGHRAGGMESLLLSRTPVDHREIVNAIGWHPTLRHVVVSHPPDEGADTSASWKFATVPPPSLRPPAWPAWATRPAGHGRGPPEARAARAYRRDVRGVKSFPVGVAAMAQRLGEILRGLRGVGPADRAAPVHGPWVSLLRGLYRRQVRGSHRHDPGAPCVHGCGTWGHHGRCTGGVCVESCAFVDASVVVEPCYASMMRGFSVCEVSGRLHYCHARVGGATCALGATVVAGVGGRRITRCWMSGAKCAGVDDTDDGRIADQAADVAFGESRAPDTRRDMCWVPAAKRPPPDDVALIGPKCRRRRISPKTRSTASVFSSDTSGAPRDRTAEVASVARVMDLYRVLVQGEARLVIDRNRSQRAHAELGRWMRARATPPTLVDVAARFAGYGCLSGRAAWWQRENRYRALHTVAVEAVRLRNRLLETHAGFAAFQSRADLFAVAYAYLRADGYRRDGAWVVAPLPWLHAPLPVFRDAPHILRREKMALVRALTHHASLLRTTLDGLDGQRLQLAVGPGLGVAIPGPSVDSVY